MYAIVSFLTPDVYNSNRLRAQSTLCTCMDTFSAMNMNHWPVESPDCRPDPCYKLVARLMEGVG